MATRTAQFLQAQTNIAQRLSFFLDFIRLDVIEFHISKLLMFINMCLI